jgi:hypothetical protein
MDLDLCVPVVFPSLDLCVIGSITLPVLGMKYRVPMYLATSFSEDKAYEFW